MRDSKEAALETVLDETGSCILTADTLSTIKGAEGLDPGRFCQWMESSDRS